MSDICDNYDPEFAINLVNYLLPYIGNLPIPENETISGTFNDMNFNNLYFGGSGGGDCTTYEYSYTIYIDNISNLFDFNLSTDNNNLQVCFNDVDEISFTFSDTLGYYNDLCVLCDASGNAKTLIPKTSTCAFGVCVDTPSQTITSTTINLNNILISASPGSVEAGNPSNISLSIDFTTYLPDGTTILNPNNPILFPFGDFDGDLYLKLTICNLELKLDNISIKSGNPTISSADINISKFNSQIQGVICQYVLCPLNEALESVIYIKTGQPCNTECQINVQNEITNYINNQNQNN